MTLFERIKQHIPHLSDRIASDMLNDVQDCLFIAFPDLLRKPEEAQDDATEAVFKALRTQDRPMGKIIVF